MNVGESLAERNSLVFFGSELPMLHQECQRFINNHDGSGKDNFFMHCAVGPVLAGLLAEANCRRPS